MPLVNAIKILAIAFALSSSVALGEQHTVSSTL